jgi:hypothetical protein
LLQRGINGLAIRRAIDHARGPKPTSGAIQIPTVTESGVRPADRRSMQIT